MTEKKNMDELNMPEHFDIAYYDGLYMFADKDAATVPTKRYIRADLAQPPSNTDQSEDWEEAKEIMRGVFVPDYDEEGRDHQKLWMQVIDELGIYPAAVNDTPRTEWQTGWSEAVMKCTSLMCDKLRNAAKSSNTDQSEALAALDWIEKRYKMLDRPIGALEHTIEALYNIRAALTRKSVDVEALKAACKCDFPTEKEDEAYTAGWHEFADYLVAQGIIEKQPTEKTE